MGGHQGSGHARATRKGSGRSKQHHGRDQCGRSYQDEALLERQSSWCSRPANRPSTSVRYSTSRRTRPETRSWPRQNGRSCWKFLARAAPGTGERAKCWPQTSRSMQIHFAAFRPTSVGSACFLVGIRGKGTSFSKCGASLTFRPMRRHSVFIEYLD